MAPSDYILSRELATQVVGHDRSYFTTMVDGRPYLPNFAVDILDTTTTASVCHAALVTVVHSICIAITKNDDGACDVEDNIIMGSLATAQNSDLKPISISIDWDSLLQNSTTSLACTKVTGGITNALFRVSGFQALKPAIASAVAKLSEYSGISVNNVDALLDFNSVLVRIFGAEGMIDRDVETSTYAALCDAGIAYRYLGRFKNGRIEGWLDGFEALTCSDLATGEHCTEIAKEMARLHCMFQLPDGELRDHHYGTDVDAVKVGLWDQLNSWMKQAKGYSEFKTQNDTERVKLLELDKIEVEVRNLISSFTFDSSDADVAERKKRIVFW